MDAVGSRDVDRRSGINREGGVRRCGLRSPILASDGRTPQRSRGRSLLDGRVDDLPQRGPYLADPCEAVLRGRTAACEPEESGIEGPGMDEAVVAQPMEGIRGLFQMVDELASIEIERIDEIERGVDVDVVAVVG